MLQGTVVDADTQQPVEYASLLLAESGLWAISGDKGQFCVKGVQTRRGKSPFIVEGSLSQHTRQIALSKGFGALNASFEHARSFADAASPHTAYQRNILSLRYTGTFFTQTMPLTLSVGLTGNIGGYDSKADPDEELDDHTKVRDNALRSTLDIQWLTNKPWLTNLRLSASFACQDCKQEAYTHTSSASTQPCLHATTSPLWPIALRWAPSTTPPATTDAAPTTTT